MTRHDNAATVAGVENWQLQERLIALEDRVSKLEEARQPEPKKRPRTRGHRIHEHWTPDQATIDRIADELGVTVDVLGREHVRFVDYWIAQPGQKGVKLDWDATWRNWMRKASEQGNLISAKTSNRTDNKMQGYVDRGARLAELARAGEHDAIDS